MCCCCISERAGPNYFCVKSVPRRRRLCHLEGVCRATSKESTVGKPWGACAGVPRPASSLQHPSPQHPWLRHAPLPSCLPPSARTVTPLFMRSQVNARVGLCSSTTSTSSPSSRTPFVEVTCPVSGGHARSLAFSPPHPPSPFFAPAHAPCAIDLYAADRSWFPAYLHLLVFPTTFHGPRMGQERRHGDGRRPAARLPEDSPSPPPPPFSLHVQSMCFAHSMHTQGAGRIVGRLVASD